MKSSRSIMNLILKACLFLLITAGAYSYQQGGVLQKYNFKNEDVLQINLSKGLNEISGLAISDGRLFCHNDEFATIYELEISTGKVVKKFSLESPALKGDFEDLVILDSRFYLVESNGNIYSFREGEDGQTVDYQKIKTKLKSKNDIEGIQYCPTKDKLLLLCKESAGKKNKGFRAIYELDLKSGSLNLEPKILMNIKEVKSKTRRKNFNPSAIKLTDNQTYLILDGKGKSLVEVDLEGKIINVVALKKSLHNQPEGLEILNNHTIIISDEAAKSDAKLTFYPMEE